MTAAVDPLDRLVGALEALLAEEATVLASSDFDRLGEIQLRSAAVVERLAAYADVADDRHRARIALAVETRATTVGRMIGQMERVRAELTDLQSCEHRFARVGPAYASRDIPVQRFRLAL